jgi:ADP-ribose pyrophosphatase YjhB (NUDIX family)
VLVIVPRRQSAQGDVVLALPKGHVDPGETPEEAATREVREETGVTAELGEQLGEVRYSFQRRGGRVDKTVVFFRFEYVSGSTDDHDDEVLEARWIPGTEAVRRLTYPGERQMVERALSRSGPNG